MIRNGKDYKQLTEEYAKQHYLEFDDYFGFIDDFEKENAVSIRVREKDLDKVRDFIEERKATKEDLLATEIPFDMFELNFNQCRVYVRKSKNRFYTDVSEKPLDFAILSKNRSKVACGYTMNDKEKAHLIHWTHNQEDLPTILGFSEIAREIMFYILNQKKSVVYIDDKKKVNKKAQTEKVKNGNKVHNITIDDAVVYACKGVSTGRKIQAECYGVRGHYRHYKSGLTVFIKPYKKGWNRNGQVPAKQQYTL